MEASCAVAIMRMPGGRERWDDMREVKYSARMEGFVDVFN